MKMQKNVLFHCHSVESRANIYDTSVAHDNHHLQSSYCYSPGHRSPKNSFIKITLNFFVQTTNPNSHRRTKRHSIVDILKIFLFPIPTKSQSFRRPSPTKSLYAPPTQPSYAAPPSYDYSPPRAQCYKTFSVRNLRIFVIS
jgi:hypothetical protein